MIYIIRVRFVFKEQKSALLESLNKIQTLNLAKLVGLYSHLCHTFL